MLSDPKILLLCQWGKDFNYIHTEKYSPKSCVVNFDTQMSSRQSEEWTMVFTREKKWDGQSESRKMFFSHVRKMIRPNRIHRGVWVSRQNSLLFLQLAERRFALIRGEKFFSKSFFLLKKWKTFQKWSGIVSIVCFTVDKGNCGELAKQQRKGKNRTRRKLILWFLSELLCLPFISLSLYWKRLFYLNSLIFNCTFRTAKITCSSWITSYPYRHLCF